MNRTGKHRETPESDPVWDLLSNSPPPQAGPMFARDVLRAARLESAAPAEQDGWWSRAWAGIVDHPVHSAGRLAALAAAVTIGIVMWPQTRAPGPERIAGTVPATAAASAAAANEPFAELQEIAEEEFLLAASEDLSMFSDAELVALLGF